MIKGPDNPVFSVQKKTHLIYKITFLFCYNMKSNKYHNVGTVPKSNRTMVEREKLDTPNTYLHDRLDSWSGTDSLIKRDGLKLIE